MASLSRTLLLHDRIRSYVVKARLFYYAKVRRRLRFLNAPDSDPETIAHNMRSLRAGNARMHALLRPLAAIETLDKNSKILVIGPRNESDLLLLHAYGYSLRNVRGLDIISYSPWVDLGDMHGTPYADGQWDAVILAWCLTYSLSPDKVAEEVTRIVKPGGLVAVGLEYSTLTRHDVKDLLGYSLGREERVNSVGQIHALFGEHLGHVYYSHDAPLRRSHSKSGSVGRPSAVCTIFSIAKTESGSAVKAA